MPQTSIGRPTFAYSKKPKPLPIFCKADCAIKLPGAPISDRLPPSAAANTSGISRRERVNPDLAATPITTGIKTAAVPVLEKTGHYANHHHNDEDQLLLRFGEVGDHATDFVCHPGFK